MIKKLIIYLYRLFIKFIYFNNWKHLNDEYSKHYTASPKKVDEYIFFNKINYELAKSCNEINKKSILKETKIAKLDYEIISKYMFLNLTDNSQDNLFLFNIVKNFYHKKKIKFLIYRFHPQHHDKVLLSELSKLQIKKTNYYDQFNDEDKKIINEKNCEFIVSAASSVISNLNRYAGTIILSRNASSFLNDNNFYFFLKVIKKNLNSKIKKFY